MNIHNSIYPGTYTMLHEHTPTPSYASTSVYLASFQTDRRDADEYNVTAIPEPNDVADVALLVNEFRRPLLSGFNR